MNKLYFVKLNGFGIWEDKIYEYDIEKETQKMIYAKENSFKMRIPTGFLVERQSLYLGKWYIFRKDKEKLKEALKRRLEIIKESYKKAINGVEKLG